MKTHNTRLKEDHILKYLEKNLKDCPEKRFTINKLKDSFEDFNYDADFEEWVTLPENSYVICDKCKKEVQEYWHKHTAYTHLEGEPMLITPPNWTEICLCKKCHKEMVNNMWKRKLQ